MKLTSRAWLFEAVLLASAVGVGWAAGCVSAGQSTADGNDASSTHVDAGKVPSSQPDASASLCKPCLSNADCGGGVCAQVEGDSFCLDECATSQEVSPCAVGSTCSLETSSNGTQVSVCVPTAVCPGGARLASAPDASASAGDAAACAPASSNCGGYAAPETPSSCDSCSKSSASCQPNGCYGGWYCNLSTSTCHLPPSGCSSSSGTPCPSSGSGSGSGTNSGGSSSDGSGTGSGASTATTVSGTVGSTGGTVSSLLFAIAGDTRPPNEDDTSGYPSTIIETIFSDIEARSPRPPFVISTGDYQFANPTGTQSAPQLNLFMSARATYTGAWFPAMGNHECTGYTVSNCGSGNTNGLTSNYSNFLSLMLAPIGQTKPYYAIDVNGADGSWTSKFVFVAANAWDSTQSSWLDSTLQQTTTYTFVIRHEANEANTAPGTTPSETIVKKYPLTLEICGHTHDYSKQGNRIVMGNGGAPLTGAGDYGYGVVTQRSDGNLIVDEYDYKTNQIDSTFHFVVTPSGTLTQ